MKKKTYTIDMCNGSIAPKLIRFALPVMLSSVLQLTFNTADVIVVGKFVGDTSQAAVTSTGSLVFLIVSLFSGMSAGSNVMAGQAIGSGDRDQIGRVVHTAVLLGMVGGLTIGVVGYFISPVLLRWTGSPESVFGLAKLYLQVYFLGIPADMVYNFGAGLMRASGDTKRPMYYLFAAGLINVTLNVFFVVALHWDVVGVAAATAISRYVAAGLVIRALRHETGSFHLNLRKLAMDPAALRGIVRIGLPSGVSNSMFALSNTAVQSAINSLGEIAMAGSGAVANIGTFVQLGGTSYDSACVAYTSQNYGAGKTDRIERGIRRVLVLSIGSVLLLGSLALVFGPQLLSLYTNDPQVIEQGMIRMNITIPGYLLMAVMTSFSGCLQGMGWSIAPMLVSLTCTCGLRVLWVSTVFRAVGTPQSLYWAYPVSWFAAGAALVVCFLLKRKSLYAQAEEAARKREQAKQKSETE